MRWFDYKAELDAVHASDDLKARLLALQSTASPAGQTVANEMERPRRDTAAPAREDTSPAPQPKARRAPLHFPHGSVKLLVGLAACFAFGMFSVDVLGWSFIPRMGSSLGVKQDSLSYNAVAPSYGSAAAGATSDSFAPEMPEIALDSGAEAAVPQTAARTRDTARKIVYTATLSLESKTYDDTLAALHTALDAAGGYIESSDETIYQYSNTRSLSLTLRVPADAYDAFMSNAADAGNLTSRTENAEDITAQYVDVAARIASLETKRTRLQALEAQAENLSDLLEIENSLSDVQYQLESWQSQMAVYDDRVDYCTVTVALEEVQTYTPAKTSFWQRAGSAFVEGMTSFGDAVQSFVIGVVALWPWLVVLALVAAVVVFLRRRKLRAAKRNKPE